MILFPHIFSQLQGQFFHSDATFPSHSSLKVSTESFQIINVITALFCLLYFTSVYQSMHLTFGRNTNITFPGIRTNNRILLSSLINQRILFIFTSRTATLTTLYFINFIIRASWTTMISHITQLNNSGG